MSRFISFLSCSALLLSPAIVVVVDAQFGVAGGRKKAEGTTFQELNEKAKAGGDGGNMDDMMKQMGLDPSDLQKMMGDIDPEALKELTELGPKFDEMMELMANMSPEELQKQMKDAMDMFTGDDMMEGLMANKDMIMKTMEESGVLSEEELAKMKTDPEYLEQKIKEGLGQMQELFSDPEVMKIATESMEAASDLYKNPDKLNDMVGEMGEMMGDMMGELTDEQIEEARKLFTDPKLAESNPMLKNMMDSMGGFGQLEDALQDAKKFRDQVKSGIGMMENAKANLGEKDGRGGARVGEL